MLKTISYYFAFSCVLLCHMLFSNFTEVPSQCIAELSVLNSFGTAGAFY